MESRGDGFTANLSSLARRNSRRNWEKGKKAAASRNALGWAVFPRQNAQRRNPPKRAPALRKRTVTRVSGDREPRVGLRAGAGDVLLELLTELLEEAHRGHRRTFAEGADGVAHDVVGNVAEVVDVGHRRAAVEDLLQRAVQP